MAHQRLKATVSGGRSNGQPPPPGHFKTMDDLKTCAWCGADGLLVRNKGIFYQVICPHGCGYRVTYSLKEYESLAEEDVDN
jgi:hypothetical protein